MAAAKPLVSAVTVHAWNKDGTILALSPNNHEIHIYETDKSDKYENWKRTHVLDEHGGFVSGLDWSPVTNQLVSCGHDRNAYVWKQEGGEWKPTLVLLRIDRAATAVKWSPLGNKFAVTSGAKQVPVCRYEANNDWWVSTSIKKHKSTVLSVAWSPNNKYIVTGCADNRVRIFSAYMADLDPAGDDGFGTMGFKGNVTEFGAPLYQFDIGSWAQGVSWSPNGLRIAVAGHGSTISFVQLAAGSEPVVTTVRTTQLPFLETAFLNDNEIVAVGYSCNPARFAYGANGWAFKDELDKPKEKSAAADKSTFSAARTIFADSASKGIAIGQTADDTELPTRHQNTIISVWRYSDKKVTTAGLDGNVFFWDL